MLSWLLLAGLLAPKAIAEPVGVQITNVGTYPEFSVNGRPFFVHAAAFLYPRVPRDLWERSLSQYKTLGINTVDLYIPWNWHEPKDGEFDFDGHTNPRKDLLGLFATIKRLGLRAIVRPGPYICAEWRNGGYPDWLLHEPAYKMSRRALLEGRYPPLSSVQYTDPEIAAKGWLENSRHLKYTKLWYAKVAATIIKPFSAESGGPILLVQLDDDQGAGSRRDGRYFWKYMAWLRDEMRAQGVGLPLFLDPPETENPSLGDEALGKDRLWLMTQWYQRFLGTDLSTASLSDIESAIQPIKMSSEFPPGVIEFNAGFFGMENDPYGMASLPINTLAASRVLIQNGLKVLNNYPIQDSLYPAGYEIASANRYSVWESAFDVNGARHPKADFIERNGDLIRTFGSLLAASHEWADVGLLEPTHAMISIQTSTAAFSAVDKEITSLGSRMDELRLANDWVDPQAQPIEQLLRYPALIRPVSAAKLSSKAERVLRDYETQGGRILSSSESISQRHVQAAPGLYASELVSDEGSLPLGRRDESKRNYGFVFLTNLYARDEKGDASASDPYDSTKRISLGKVDVPARGSVALPLRIPLNRLSDRPASFFADSDELYSSDVELSRAEMGDGDLRLGFRAPEGGTIRLRLAQVPGHILLNDQPASMKQEEQQVLWRLEIPPAKSDSLQWVDLVFADKSETVTPIPSRYMRSGAAGEENGLPAAKAGALDRSGLDSGLRRNDEELRWEFPSRVDYRVRPDVTLASRPDLVLGDESFPLVLENASSKGRAVTLNWDHRSRATVLEPHEKQREELPMDASPGIHSASIVLESEGTRTEIPVQYVHSPAKGVVVYPFDFDRDGSQEIVLENSKLRVVVDPTAGGRIVQLVDKRRDFNVASPAGLLRDQFTLSEPLDTSWEDKKLPTWTRSRAPGLNTRPYSVEKTSEDSVMLAYRADDVSYQGASIHKTLRLDPISPEVDVHYEIVVSSGDSTQEFKIRDVPFVESGSTMIYEQSGKPARQTLERDFDKRFRTRWISIENGRSEWKVSWPDEVWVSISGRSRYAVIEAGFGPMPAANATRSFDVLYFLGKPASP